MSVQGPLPTAAKLNIVIDHEQSSKSIAATAQSFRVSLTDLQRWIDNREKLERASSFSREQIGEVLRWHYTRGRNAELTAFQFDVLSEDIRLWESEAKNDPVGLRSSDATGFEGLDAANLPAMNNKTVEAFSMSSNYGMLGSRGSGAGMLGNRHPNGMLGSSDPSGMLGNRHSSDMSASSDPRGMLGDSDTSGMLQNANPGGMLANTQESPRDPAHQMGAGVHSASVSAFMREHEVYDLQLTRMSAGTSGRGGGGALGPPSVPAVAAPASISMTDEEPVTPIPRGSAGSVGSSNALVNSPVHTPPAGKYQMPLISMMVMPRKAARKASQNIKSHASGKSTVIESETPTNATSSAPEVLDFEEKYLQDGRTVMIWSERDYKRWLRKKLKLTPAESKVALDEQRRGFLAANTDA